jgi:MFS family permease
LTRVRLTFHRTFHSLGHSENFRRFFIGQAISVTGTWMQMVAAAWLVLQLTGSGVALGIDTALTFGPILLFGPLGGSLADRYDKRRILLATQVTFGSLAIVLWGIVATGLVELWMVYALSFLQGVATSIDQPTRQSFFAEMVEDRDLPNAVSLNSAVMTGTRIVGPALAGALIAGIGLQWCFFINACSYVAVIVALLSMHADQLRRQRAPHEAGAIREGLRYAWRTGELRRPLVLMSVLYLFSFNYSVLMPLFAERTFDGDAGTLALLFSVAGVGSLAGALVMASRPRPGERMLALAAIGVGVVTMLVALAPNLDVAVISMLPLGVASIVLRDRELDLAADLAARHARPRDGAVRDRVPRDDAVRCAHRRVGRRAPRPAGRLRRRRAGRGRDRAGRPVDPLAACDRRAARARPGRDRARRGLSFGFR